MITVALVISFFFFGREKLIVFSRLPVYLLGMYIASDREQLIMDGRRWHICIFSFVIGSALLILNYVCFSEMLWTYGLWWYPFLLIAPSVSLLLCWFLERYAIGIQYICSILAVFGRSSLEILLVSEYIFSHFWLFDGFGMPLRVTEFLTILLPLILGVLFHTCSESVMTRAKPNNN
jgi:hypothetical protein